MAEQHPGAALHSLLSILPGLRGYWPGSGFQAGRTNDFSGNEMHMSMVGNIQQQSGLWIPRLRLLSSASQYLTHTTDPILSYSPTNVTSVYRGLTLGILFYPVADVANLGLMGKYLTVGDQREYALFTSPTGLPTFAVSSDGTAGGVVEVVGTTPVTLDAWNFLIARYRVAPPTMDLWSIHEKVTLSTGVPSSIFAGNSELRIGSYDTGNYFDGHLAMAWLSGVYIPDDLVGRVISHCWKVINRL